MEAIESSFETEYRAAMEGAVAIDRSHLAAIEATGKDRESFLQNMLTNDVRTLPLFAGIPAAFLTVKGKLVSDLVAFKEADRFVLQMERERADPLLKALDRYIISEDVALRSLAELETTLSLEGPLASGILASILGVDRSSLDSLAHLQFRRLEIEGRPARLTAHRRELTPRFDVSAAPELVRSLLDRVLERGAIRGGELLREARRIEASRPRFGVDMDEAHLPQEAALEEAISFQKGCYIGQEYVVRLAHRGHVNRRLAGLRLEGMAPAPAGTVVRKGDVEIGSVTSSAPSPSFGCALALAYLKREHAEPGGAVVAGETPAVVSSLPFAPP